METLMNNGICRCCASEGTFKDVTSKYHWMGEEEIYSDMLRYCFDINLTKSESGNDGGICEVCITQLRNAANFKKQVLHTEEQFKKGLQEKLLKSTIVKVEEVCRDDGTESDNNLSEDYSGAEYDVPIKEESHEEQKPKKRAAKATTSRAKKTKTEAETSTKRIGRETTKIEIVLDPKVSKHLKPRSESAVKVENPNDWTVTITKKNSAVIKPNAKSLKIVKKEPQKQEISKHLQNIRMILLNSNATPIRRYGALGYACSFCTDQYLKAADLKTHTISKHDSSTKSKFMKGHTLTAYVVKLDITSLSCDLCTKSIDGLEQLMSHLKTEHGKELYTDIKNHILPFKFDSEAFQCAICSKTFEYFKSVQEHMSVHYRNYECDVCNAPFVNTLGLQNHSRIHKQGDFACSHCAKVFDTKEKKANHEKFVHLGDYKERNKCPQCLVKFTTHANKMNHMVKVHNVQPRVVKCLACDKTFISKDRLSLHTRRDHLLERKYECSECDKKFFQKEDLANHMTKHTGVRQHKCDVCLKAFTRKSTLREHLRIHADDRRFKCTHCGQRFVQKCSWKSHMRSKHREVV